MMYKKIIITFLLMMIPFGLRAQSEVTDIGTARYYADTTVEENVLPKGVIHYEHKGFTSAKEGEVTDMGMNVTETFVPDKYYPQTINMLEIPKTANVELVPWAYIEDSAWQLRTVREIANNYEQHHPGKKVVAAVNGDFFDIQGGKMYPYTPHSTHASQGNHYKSIARYRALGFLNDGSDKPLVGNTNILRNSLPTLEILNEQDEVLASFMVDVVNGEPQNNELAVIYPKYGITSHNAKATSQPVSVDDAYIIDATHVIPITDVQGVYGYESDNLDFFGKGVVERFGSGVLVNNAFALKTTNQAIKEALEVGVRVRVQYNFTGEFEGVENIIGYNQVVMYNNKKVHSITQRAPRTMVGVKADGTVLLTVIDGRRPDKGLYGASMAEMMAVMTHYGAVDAYNLDGGGSSTMVILDKTLRVTNTISDAYERRDANALLVVMDIPEVTLDKRTITDSTIKFIPTIKNLNGYQEDDLYVSLNNVLMPLNNASFDNLEKETIYTYKLMYKENNLYYDAYYSGSVKTAKRRPYLKGISLSYRSMDVLVHLHIDDPDDTVVEGYVTIGDVKINITGGIAVLRDFKHKPLDEIKVVIFVDLMDEVGRVPLNDDYPTYKSAEIVFNISYQQFINHINDVFKEDS